ncbi:MAG: DNA polymerase III subunit gamma/tau, partial [Pseudomonadota bacterium]
SNHQDVLEIDAASNTGVDNIRELIENARYKPTAARYKVFIIDEVHMLSKGAFNALLKTLEEPPEHAKFIFATTEVRKVPVTVLSRCQRFDLRRVSASVLTEHFTKIVAAEQCTADERGLALIARAAQGSVRDGLSMLDQALAIGSGNVTALTVQQMLGLADRQRTLDLLDHIFAGQAGEALLAFDALHADGADPLQIIVDLAEAVHLMTRSRVAGAEHLGAGLASDERARLTSAAEKLSVPLLSRAWQLLSKGAEDISRAGDDKTAAEMLLVRVCYTAQLPGPEELAGMVVNAAPGSGSSVPNGQTGGNGSGEGPTAAGDAQGEHGAPGAPRLAAGPSTGNAMGTAANASNENQPGAQLGSLRDVAELLGVHRAMSLRLEVEEYLRPVSFEPGMIDVALTNEAPRGLISELARKLTELTGMRWVIVVSKERGGQTIAEENEAERTRILREVEASPAMQAFRKTFPDARIESVKPLAGSPGLQDQGGADGKDHDGSSDAVCSPVANSSKSQ